MTDAYTCSVEGLARKTPALVYVFRTWCPACMVTKPIVTQAFKQIYALMKAGKVPRRSLCAVCVDSEDQLEALRGQLDAQGNKDFTGIPRLALVDAPRSWKMCMGPYSVESIVALAKVPIGSPPPLQVSLAGGSVKRSRLPRKAKDVALRRIKTMK